MSWKLVAVAAVVAATAATAAARNGRTTVGTTPPAHGVRITVSPRTVVPYGSAGIEVEGLPEATSVEVLLEGASSILGAPMPWIALRRRPDGSWSAHLPQPVLPGIYPIKLRTQPTVALTVTQAAYLRVYWDGTETNPLFSTPDQVAEWWVRRVAGGTLGAIRRWPGQPIDHRLASLNRLFVVAYSPPGLPAPSDRLGVWITAVREGYGGGWRLLEATVTPP